MSDGSVLHELVKSLSEKERKQLLDKIQSSLSLEETSENNIFPKKMNNEEREVLIIHDIENTSLFTRFRLWLKSVLSGKDKKEIFLNMKIASLKTSVQRKYPGLTGFETRDLSPKFANEFFTLYTAVHPLTPLYKSIWKTQGNLESALIVSLEKRIREPKKDIYELSSKTELEQLFEQTESKTAIKDQVLDRINRYIDSIPAEVVQQVEEQIQPIYYLKDVVLFPYNDFFKLFHFAPKPQDTKPSFKSASAFLALEYLEKMVYALYMIMKIRDSAWANNEFIEDLVSFYLSERKKSKNDGDLKTVEKEQITEIIRGIEKAIKKVKEFSKSMPLVELIRYFRKDPYYQLIFYVPKLDIREFYLSTLKMRFLPQIDGKYLEIRKTVVDRKVEALFGKQNINRLMNYREYQSIDTQSKELPQFSFVKTINLLYSYILIFYKKNIQEAIQIVSRGILLQNRITLNRLLLHAASIEDLEEKIELFDKTLSTEEEDGKLFQKIRFSLSTDTTHQRLFRNLISQKDKEAESLIEKGKESFTGIKRVFHELLETSMETLKTKLDTHYMIHGKSTSLRDLLGKHSDHIDAFTKLLNQMMRVEMGS